MFESLLRREIAFFDEEANAVGTLTTRLADDSRAVNKAFGEGLAKQLQAAFTLLLGLALGFSATWQVAFVVLACFPLSIVSSAIQMQAISGQQYDNETEDATTNGPNKAVAKTKAISDGKQSTDKKNGSVAATTSAMAGGSGSMLATAFTNMRTVSAFSLHYQVAHKYSTSTRKVCDF
jgi:ABC-type multidrug transport system fused ATPase/permease subunit